MSATEYTPQEGRSSVKISQTAKGDPVVEVKAYSHDLEALEQTRLAAVAAFNATLRDLGTIR